MYKFFLLALVSMCYLPFLPSMGRMPLCWVSFWWVSSHHIGGHDIQSNNTQHKDFCYIHNDQNKHRVSYWMSLCWLFLCWVSPCCVPSCWMSLCWLYLCWVSPCCVPSCWMSLCWVPSRQTTNCDSVRLKAEDETRETLNAIFVIDNGTARLHAIQK